MESHRGGGADALGGAGGSGIIIFALSNNVSATFSGGVTQTNATSGGVTTYTVTAAGPTDTVTIGV